MNPHKWLLTAVECGLLFVRDTEAIASALVVDPLYLQHQHPDAIDYRHWSEIFFTSVQFMHCLLKKTNFIS